MSGNTASQTAGGIYSFLGTTTLVNVTVSANSAPTGGGIVNAANTATVTLTNTIVAGQKSGGDVSGNFTGDHNVIGVNNPLLAPLGDYGGPTQTMPLLPGSPASGAVPAARASRRLISGVKFAETASTSAPFRARARRSLSTPRPTAPAPGSVSSAFARRSTSSMPSRQPTRSTSPRPFSKRRRQSLSRAPSCYSVTRRVPQRSQARRQA